MELSGYPSCINSFCVWSRARLSSLRSQAIRMDETQSTPLADRPDVPGLTRHQARRLREVYRSAGWPSQDALEIELLAGGMLERVADPGGFEKIRLTDGGINALAQALGRNKRALSAHDALVAKVAQMLLRDGRVVWTGLSVRARLSPALDAAALAPFAVLPVATPLAAPVRDMPGQPALASASGAPKRDFQLDPGATPPPGARWKVCKPDVFSIRNTSVAAYLQPVVHEIKVSRADLLGDLRLPDKREAYLDLGGQCWYVLGCDARGRPIAQAEEVPSACGVIFAFADGRLEIARHAPRRVIPDLPFALWMALAKATPLPSALAGLVADEPSQALLDEQPPTEP